MKNSRSRREDELLKELFQNMDLRTRISLTLKQIQREEIQEKEFEAYKKTFVWWKIILNWLLKLTTGGGTV